MAGGDGGCGGGAVGSKLQGEGRGDGLENPGGWSIPDDHSPFSPETRSVVR